MSILYALEQIRNPVLDGFLSTITYLGGEAVFMAVALALFWCVDKNRGYYMLTVGFLGTVLNQFLKLVFRIPRPWVRDPAFTIVEAARAEATGYSFPSGHTQNVLTIFGCLARGTKRRVLRGVYIAVVALVAFSRMYLGVHYPMDVGVSLVLGVVLVLALYPLFESVRQHPNRMYAILGMMLLVSAAYTAYARLWPFPADIDPVNLQEGLDNGWKLTGAVAGMLLAYYLDQTKLHFPTRAPWWAQIVKTVVGLGLLIGVKSVLKTPLLTLCGGLAMAHGIRYFIMVLFAAVVWPLTFPWFARQGKNQSGQAEDRTQ